MMQISKKLNIYFDKLKSWEIKLLIKASQDELKKREAEPEGKPNE